MNTSLQYFLVVAEELNISRAAERLFVSQQSVSSHIKKLEQYYKVELFARKPSFKLTPEGEALQRNLKRQHILENSLSLELKEIGAQRINHLRVGLHNTRTGILLPSVISHFYSKYPDALVDVQQGSTRAFESMLLSGNLDLFLATSTVEQPEFRRIFKCQEQNFLVASIDILKRAKLDSVIETKRLSASNLSKFPFICSPSDSYLQSKIDTWLLSNNISVQKRVIVGAYQNQLMLAAQNIGACICPQMFFPLISNINLSSPESAHLIPIAIDGFNVPTELSVVIHRDAYQHTLLQEFSSALVQAISNALETKVFL